MQILLFIPVLLVAFYAFYKFTKDDYIFIRRNISLEQMFDIAFNVLWVSLFFGRAIYFIYHPVHGKNIFFEFFTPDIGELSLIGAIIGGMGGLYLIGKYKRVPLGRLFDFFTLSLMIALPLGFLANLIFSKGYFLILNLASSLVYFIIIFIFLRLLYPKLLNRTLREGNISIFFLILFSILTLITSLIDTTKALTVHLSIQTILPGVLFLFSIGLLIKQERSRLRTRRYK